jgi:putative intracellular protease/amidase
MRIQLMQAICLGIISVFLAGCSVIRIDPTPIPSPTPVPPTRALLVIQEHFNESEYSEPRTLLEEEGVVVTVASFTMEVVTAYGNAARVEPDLLVGDVQAEEYDIIIFVGGYPYDPDLTEMHRIAQDAQAAGRALAGICNGVITLANAGVLQGVQVTDLIYHDAAVLEEAGAILSDADVERDGPVITGSGPGAAREFGEVIVQALLE